MQNNQETIMHHLVFFITTINAIDRGFEHQAHSPETTMMKDYIYELKALLIQEGVITEHGMQRVFSNYRKFGRQYKQRMRTRTDATIEQEIMEYETRMQRYLAARGEKQ
jgi:hypothetical protein